MIDVDGRVVNAQDLIRRIEQLAGPAVWQPSANDDPREWHVTPVDPPTRHMIPVLAGTVQRIHPPNPPAERGLNARGRWGVKRLFRKLLGWQNEPRWTAQRELDEQLIHFAATADSLFATLTSLSLEMRAELEGLRTQVGRIVEHQASERADSEARIGELVGTAETLRAGIADVDAKLAANTAAMKHGLSQRASHDEVELLRRDAARLHERLGTASADGAQIDYAAFEDRMRGDSSQLKAMQAEYVSKFPSPGEYGLMVDVGCGRGEMVELLLEAGHEVIGIDPDPAMVAVCVARGLPVVQTDAMLWLSDQPEGSLKGVFCAQVVEHLLTSELETFLRLVHEKLRPHGVLVMETINPRSLFAIGNHFFADTSHVRPVHPETLRFMCEQTGFSNAALMELSLHPWATVPDDVPPGGTRDALDALLSNFFGYQDYAIVATK